MVLKYTIKHTIIPPIIESAPFVTTEVQVTPSANTNSLDIYGFFHQKQLVVQLAADL